GVKNAFIVQIMFDKSTQFAESLLRSGYEILKADFDVIWAQLPTSLPALANDPLPILAVHHHAALGTPWVAMQPWKFFHGEGDVATIPYHMNDESIRDHSFNKRENDDVFIAGLRPTVDALIAG